MSYEAKVQKRRLENKRLLESLGVFSARKKFAESVNSKITRISENSMKQNSIKKKKPHRPIAVPSRKSIRLLNKETPNYAEIENAVNTIKARKFSSNIPKHPLVKRENVFGAIPDIPVGTAYDTRLEASHDGIHRPTVAGIHGNPDLGCYSIALSGGYEDDVDNGDAFIYTGEGGRDLKGTKANPKNLRTAAQSKDQVLLRGNLALAKSCKNKLPVRVLRGYKLRSEYAPKEGYRYDGLYKVEKYFLATGQSGFEVYKFCFERLDGQKPAPWKDPKPALSDNS